MLPVEGNRTERSRVRNFSGENCNRALCTLLKILLGLIFEIL